MPIVCQGSILGLDAVIGAVVVMLLGVGGVVFRIWRLEAAGRETARLERDALQRDANEQRKCERWRAEGEARVYQSLVSANQQQPREQAAAARAAAASGPRAGGGRPSPARAAAPAVASRRAAPRSAKPRSTTTSLRGAKGIDGKLARLLLDNDYSGHVLTVRSYASAKGLVGFEWEVTRDSVAGGAPPRVCGRRGDEIIFVEYAWKGQKADVVPPGSRHYYTFTVTSPHEDELADPDLEKDLGFEVVVPIDAAALQPPAAAAPAPVAVESADVGRGDRRGDLRLDDLARPFVEGFDAEIGSAAGLGAEGKRLVETLRERLAPDPHPIGQADD